MKRFLVVLLALLFALAVLAGCSGQSQSSSASGQGGQAESFDPSSWPITPLPNANPGSGSSDAASSDRVSSDKASSDRASSNKASSEKASSNRVSSNIASSGRASSGAVSSGKASSGAASSASAARNASGLVEMNVAMQYISSKDALAAINAKDKNKVFVDLRKPEDAQKGAIAGAIFAPMNGAVDNNDYADAIANITGALYDATGNEVGEGKEIVLVCYAGKKYAQAATDILNALGANMDQVYTLEGGMTAWNEAGLPTVAR